MIKFKLRHGGIVLFHKKDVTTVVTRTEHVLVSGAVYKTVRCNYAIFFTRIHEVKIADPVYKEHQVVSIIVDNNWFEVNESLEEVERLLK